MASFNERKSSVQPLRLGAGAERSERGVLVPAARQSQDRPRCGVWMHRSAEKGHPILFQCYRRHFFTGYRRLLRLEIHRTAERKEEGVKSATRGLQDTRKVKQRVFTNIGKPTLDNQSTVSQMAPDAC